MSQELHGRTYIHFDERPSKFMKDWNVKTFDVVIRERYYDWQEEDSDEDQNKLYCNALLELLKKIKPDFQEECLKYQCELLEMPVSWLRALEELIDQNNDFFYKTRSENLIPSWYLHISTSLAGYQDQLVTDTKKIKPEKNSISPIENPFDLEKVKKHQLHLPRGFQRLAYLLRMKTNYLHHQYKYNAGNHLPFHKQIKLELAYQKFEEAFYKKQTKSKESNNRNLKITINGSIGLMAHAFKCMMNHPGNGNAPFLQIGSNGAMIFLQNNVKRQDNEPIDESNLRSVFFEEDDNDLTKIESSKLPLSHIRTEHYYLWNINFVIEILQAIPEIEFRILFLMRVKTNYLQHCLVDDKDRVFEIRINREIAHQKKLRKMQVRKLKLIEVSEPRIRINGQINVFVQVFYELLMEFKGADGRPYLVGNKKKLVRFICKYFVDKNDGDLSPNTLYSLLKPTNGWKRCPLHKRIHLNSNKYK